MNAKLLETIFSISLKARILREWQKSNRAEDQEFQERDLLCLELINDFGPITEKGLCKVFGLQFSSISDIVNRLTEKGFIEKQGGTRGKPLALTETGRKRLTKLKQDSAVRLGYLFSTLEKQDEDSLISVFNKIDKAAAKHVNELVFDRYSSTDSDQKK